MRTVVVGDVHSNYESLNATVKIINDRGCDQVVFIGDILTYGTDPNRCVEEILNLSQRFNVEICLGNHDQTYLELLGAGSSEYYDSLPDWIRESFDWTLSVLDVSMWQKLSFVDSFRSRYVLFSHANPYGRNCWSYINSFDDHVKVLSALNDQGFRLGVFGHTHRKKIFVQNVSGSFEFLDTTALNMIDVEHAVVNVGSIGQPRGLQETSLLWIEGIDTQQPRLIFEKFEYPKARCIEALMNIHLSSKTREKLMCFFK